MPPALCQKGCDSGWREGRGLKSSGAAVTHRLSGAVHAAGVGAAACPGPLGPAVPGSDGEVGLLRKYPWRKPQGPGPRGLPGVELWVSSDWCVALVLCVLLLALRLWGFFLLF